MDQGWDCGAWLQQLGAGKPNPLKPMCSSSSGSKKKDLKDLDLRGDKEKRIRTQIHIWPDNMSNHKLSAH